MIVLLRLMKWWLFKRGHLNGGVLKLKNLFQMGDS